MPNINKVVFGNQTLIDLSTTTLSNASQLENGVTAYDRAGNVITGTASGGGSSTPYVLITGEQDAGGGKIVHITGAVNQTISADAGGGDVDALSATVLLDLSDDTVDAAHLISGYTAHNSMGQVVTGTLIVQKCYIGNSGPTADVGNNDDVFLILTTAYRKVNGEWIEQTDLSNAFQSGIHYVKG